MSRDFSARQYYPMSCGPTVLLVAAVELGALRIPPFYVPGLPNPPAEGWPLHEDIFSNPNTLELYQSILFYVTSGLYDAKQRAQFPEDIRAQIDQLATASPPEYPPTPPAANLTSKEAAQWKLAHEPAGYQYFRRIKTGSLPHNVCVAANMLGLNARIYVVNRFAYVALNLKTRATFKACKQAGFPILIGDYQLEENERALKLLLVTEKGLIGGWQFVLHYVLERPTIHEDQFMNPSSGNSFEHFGRQENLFGFTHYQSLGLRIVF